MSMLEQLLRARKFRSLFLAALSTIPALAQTSTSITLNLNWSPIGFEWSNAFIASQSGSAGSLGNATLVFSSGVAPVGVSGITGPAQITAELYFNEQDSIAISYTQGDPNFIYSQTMTLSGGTITGGTGKYAGASGSLDLTIVKDGGGGSTFTSATTTGSGTLVAGGQTTPITLTNLRGDCCVAENRQENFYSWNLNVTGTLGNGSGTMRAYYYWSSNPMEALGSATIAFSSTDTLNLWFVYTPTMSQSTDAPSSFSGIVSGGTGKYANTLGSLTFKPANNGFQASGTLSTSTSNATITQVNTAYGLPGVAYNTWLEIHGQNLVPADTPSTGVDWSNAPDFANGQMPTQLGPISVLINGQSAFIYWYCSAATDPSCADDQINVLAPLLPFIDPGPAVLSVLNNGNRIAVSPVFRNSYSPAFLSLDAMGHVAARHQDASLVGPASLYPGYTTPAKPGEVVSVYGTGFGPPVGSTLTNGSSTQTGKMAQEAAGLDCWISGRYATVVGALVSPGLYQFNITIPQGAPSGDDPLNCVYVYTATFPGALITIR